MNDFLEKNLEDIIYDNQNDISKRGFNEILQITERQFRLPSGKIIDLLTLDIVGDVLCVNIIELKKGVIDSAAFFQGLNYYNEFLSIVLGCFADVKAELILVGNSATQEIRDLLPLNAPVVPYLYKYDYDGIYFTKVHGSFIKEVIPIYNEMYVQNTISDSTSIEFSNLLRRKVFEFEEKVNVS